MRKLFIVPVCLISFGFIACHSDDENQTDKDLVQTVDTVKAKVDSSEVNEDETSFNLPSALQIAYVFKKSGAVYNSSLPNSVSSVTKYNVSNYKRATNFGVYSADLAYSLFNKRTQESKNYLKACKEVGSFLGLNSAFEGDDTPKRFEKNLSNEDSLIKIVSNIQMKTDLLFEQNKQKHITVLAFVGAWSESMYIANEAYAKDKNKKTLGSLLEQLSLSEVVIKALDKYKATEPQIPGLILEVEKVKLAYDNVAMIKTALEKDEELDFANITVSEAEVKSISDSVKALRKTIVD